MSDAQTVSVLLLVGVKFNLLPTEGLMQVPKIGLHRLKCRGCVSHGLKLCSRTDFTVEEERPE